MCSEFVEETLCTNCNHREVCSLTDQYLKAQKAVDDISVTLGHDGNKVSFKRLRDFDWIKRVRLECIHFTPRKVIRRDISAINQVFAENYDGTKPMEIPD